MNIEQSDAPISGLQMMSHAAEATSALLGTPPAKELPIVSSAIPSQDDIIDLVTSPLKRCPPWKGRLDLNPSTQNSAVTAASSWFSTSRNGSLTKTPTVAAMLMAEERLRKRFPKCQPLSSQFLEFLAHSTSLLDLSPTVHTDSLLVNPYVTALPLIWFSNIIYSKSLLRNVAARHFAYPQPKKTSARVTSVASTVDLWGISLPKEYDGVHHSSYQFWVVHLQGLKGPQHLKGLSTFSKRYYKTFESSLVDFFESQFDSMREDERISIREGLMKNCETMYIASFNTHKPGHPTIVAAIQYSTSADGAFISWLGVCEDIPETTKVDGVRPVRVYRRLGLGMFLQNLIQFQQISRGAAPRLLLQTIVDGDAGEYYLNRGYVRSPCNVLDSVNGISNESFKDNHLHFISDEMQCNVDVPTNMRLVLFHRDGLVVTTFVDEKHMYFFLDGAHIQCYPPDESTILFRFPYNSTGKELETYVDDDSLIMFKYPVFHPEVDYVLPENTPSQGMFKGKVRGLNQFCMHFDSADINQVEYTRLKTQPDSFLHDQTISLWGRWLLRNPEGDISKDVAIIPPLICKLVKELVVKLMTPSYYDRSLDKELVSVLDKVDKYLYGHPNLLTKRLIFFVVNDDGEHWYGFCAVNPWRCLVDQYKTLGTLKVHADYKKTRLFDHKAGLFYNDSLKTEITVPNDIMLVFPFIWLLNMMSHYRDITVSGERSQINFVHMHAECPDNYNGLHMYLMGMKGPFGNLFVDNLRSMPYKFLDRPIRSVASQPDSFNCGLCWGLFMYDTILAFHHRQYMVDNTNQEDAHWYLGSYIHSKAYLAGKTAEEVEFDQVTKPLCQLWRWEMLLLIERLRWCFLSSKYCDIVRPKEWGVASDVHQKAIRSKRFSTHLLPIIQGRNKSSRSTPSGLYSKELGIRINITNPKKCPPVFKVPGYFLDSKYLVKLVLGKIRASGEWGQIIWDEEEFEKATVKEKQNIKRQRDVITFARYWCNLIRFDGDSSKIMVAEWDSNSCFGREGVRIKRAGVQGKLKDMVGDGNCLYYCILDFLHERGLDLGKALKRSYPLMGIRKILRGVAMSIDDNYWMYLAGSDKAEKLEAMFDPTVNYMDDDYTRNPANVACMGDQWDVTVFAAAFKVRAVIYSVAGTSHSTYYADGRNFDPKSGKGIITTSLQGIPKSKLLPMGPDVLTIVHYHTDLPNVGKKVKSFGVEQGPAHYIRVKPTKPKLIWEPTKIIPNLADHALLDHASVPITTLPEQDGNSPSKKNTKNNQDKSPTKENADDKPGTNKNDDQQQDGKTTQGNNNEGNANNSNEGGSGGGDNNNEDDKKDEDKKDDKNDNKKQEKDENEKTQKEDEEKKLEEAKRKAEEEAEQKAVKEAEEKKSEEAKRKAEEEAEQKAEKEAAQERIKLLEDAKQKAEKESAEEKIKSMEVERKKLKEADELLKKQELDAKIKKTEEENRKSKETEELLKQQKLKQEEDRIRNDEKAKLLAEKERLDAEIEKIEEERQQEEKMKNETASAKKLRDDAERMDNEAAINLASVLEAEQNAAGNADTTTDKGAESIPDKENNTKVLLQAAEEARLYRLAAQQAENEKKLKDGKDALKETSDEEKSRGAGSGSNTVDEAQNDSQEEAKKPASKPDPKKSNKKGASDKDKEGTTRKNKRDDLAPVATGTSKRKCTRTDMYAPTAFARQTLSRKRKKKEKTDALVDQVVQQVWSTVIDDVNPDATNLIYANFHCTTPLAFLQDKKESDRKWPTDSFPEHQKNWNVAYAHTKKVIGIPTSRGMLTRCSQQKRVQQWVNESYEQAKLEADLAQVNCVKEISWVPEIGSEWDTAPSEKVKKLKGYYSLKVKRHGSGDLETVTAATDWMEKNFKKGVLGVVQRVAYEKLEVMSFKTEDIPAEDRTGYVNVEQCNVTCSELDKRVINRLRYIKSKKEGKKTLPHRWFGYCNDTQECMLLVEEWVKSNFEKGYLEQLKCSSGNNGSFLKVPPGDSRKHTNIAEGSGPQIHYQQQEGERTCMVYSLASALHFLGRKDVAAKIRNDSARYRKDINSFCTFVKDLKSRHKIFRKETPGKGTVNNWWSDKLSGLYLTRLRGSDGKDDHCVAIFDNWIFDSNFKFALPRTRESFDLCCSSDDTDSTFVQVEQHSHFPGVTALN